MGIPGLSTNCRPSCESPHSFKDLKGKTVGVDVSVQLHAAVMGSEGAYSVTVVPRQPCTAVTARLTLMMQKANEHKVTLIFVFDGKRHDIKKVTDGRRAQSKDVAVQQLATSISAKSAHRGAACIRS